MMVGDRRVWDDGDTADSDSMTIKLLTASEISEWVTGVNK